MRQLEAVCHGRVGMMSGNNDIGTYVVGALFFMSSTEELQDKTQISWVVMLIKQDTDGPCKTI